MGCSVNQDSIANAIGRKITKQEAVETGEILFTSPDPITVTEALQLAISNNSVSWSQINAAKVIGREITGRKAIKEVNLMLADGSNVSEYTCNGTKCTCGGWADCNRMKLAGACKSGTQPKDCKCDQDPDFNCANDPGCSSN